VLAALPKKTSTRSWYSGGSCSFGSASLTLSFLCYAIMSSIKIAIILFSGFLARLRIVYTLIRAILATCFTGIVY
jgi:hypothetical protein